MIIASIPMKVARFLWMSVWQLLGLHSAVVVNEHLACLRRNGLKIISSYYHNV